MGACFLLPLITALIYREASSVRAFSLVAVLSIGIGTAAHLLCKDKISKLKYTPRESYFLVATVWLIASVVGCTPYILTGSIPDFFGAFFETCSGFTTTGSTVIADVESLPRAVLMWRSFTQWLGGMGIIVLFMALLPSFGIQARNIAQAETPGPMVTKLTSRFSGTAQRLYVVYIILTVSLAVLLMLGRMSLYDSVNHAFTTMATGGFSTYNDSIAHFGSTYLCWVIAVFMFLAGTNFELFFVAAQGDFKRVFKNEEFRLYLVIVLAAITGIAFSLISAGGYESIFKAVTDSAFQTTTIMSTTGYASTDFDLWPSFCQMILVILMIIGGSSSSTAGGIKVVRLLVLLKMIKREVLRKLHGGIVRDVCLDRHKLLPETITYIIGFLSMYLITLIIATFLISLSGQGDIVTNFTAVLSCISNVGPGLKGVGPTCTYTFYNSFNKFVLSIVMVAGRLELSTLFIIFSRCFWNSNRVM